MSQQVGRRRKKKRKRDRGRLIAVRLILILVAVAAIAVTGFIGYKRYGLISDMSGGDVTVTTVKVSNSGKISQTIVEEFDPGFYDEEGLRADIEEKIKASDGVDSDGLEIEDGVAVLRLKYDSDDAMAAFNDEVFYADTMDALKKQGVTFGADAILAGGGHAVIVSEAMDIKCPKRILYAEGDITIDPDNEKLAHCTVQSGDVAFVVY